MGVPDLWDIVSPAIKSRVPLSIFATDFHSANGRRLRVAIDAYIWMFETGHIPNGEDAPNKYKIVQGFVSRVCHLISCSIDFVFVFDGVLKPSFKQNYLDGVTQDDEGQTQAEVANFTNFQNLYNDSDYSNTGEDLEEAVLLKRALYLLNVAYVDAAGEAEAECSRLQNMGVVDYVISNDSDSMLFGCTKILRGFSRNFEGCEQDEFFVDPVDLDEFFTEYKVDRFRLIFFAILRGADYSGGVHRIGTERAGRIAFVNTGLNKAESGCVDFHDKFKRIFYQENILSGKLPNLAGVQQRFVKFLSAVEKEVSAKNLSYFGRRDKFILNRAPAYYIAILYFYPILSPSVFRFSPQFLSCQSSVVEETLKIDENTVPQLKSFTRLSETSVAFYRSGYKGVTMYDLGTHTIISQASSTPEKKKLEATKFNTFIQEFDQKLPKVLDVRSYVRTHFARSLILHFLSNTSVENDVYISMAKLKIVPSRGGIGRAAKEDFDSGKDLVPKWIIKVYAFKYRPAKLLAGHLGADIDQREDTVWISGQMIQNAKLEKYIKVFEKKIADATSGQLSTLESIGFINGGMISPSKSPNKPSLRRSNSVTRSPSKVMKSPRKSPKKLETGQKTIMNFFKRSQASTQKENDLLMLEDEEEDSEDDLQIMEGIMNTPSKKVPITIDVDEVSPAKNNLGVRKLALERANSNKEEAEMI